MKKFVLLSICLVISFAVPAQKMKQEKEIKMSLNETGNLVLHQTFEKPSPTNPYPAISFYIYDLSKDKIIYHDSINRGNVSWHQGSILKIWKVPGMVKQNHQASDNIIYLDACTGKKIPDPSDEGNKHKKKHDF